MFELRLWAIVGAMATLSGLTFADGSKIEFDGPEKQNPSSPEAGELRATGNYQLGAGLDLIHIEFLYRKPGATSWFREENKVKIAKKGDQLTWEINLTKIPPGDYEAQANLYMKDAQGQTIVHRMEKTRKVTVKAKDSGL